MLLEKEKPHNVYLGLGSNLGDRGENLSQAINQIEKRIGKIVATSAFYVTDPVGFDSENKFLNAACHVETHLTPEEILYVAQNIEKEMGRTIKSKDKIYADRVIDIDLLLYDDEIIHSLELELPHPQLQDRSFVLLPLAEIAGGYIHPVYKKSINELKRSLEKAC